MFEQIRVGDRVNRCHTGQRLALEKEVGLVLEIEGEEAFVQWPRRKRYRLLNRLELCGEPQELCNGNGN